MLVAVEAGSRELLSGTGGSRHQHVFTHNPSSEELRKFLPMIGCHTTTAKKEHLHCGKDDAETIDCSQAWSISHMHGLCAAGER